METRGIAAMKDSLAAVAILAAAAASGASPAEAKLACYHLKQIEHALEAEYGEKQRFTGHEAKSGAAAVEYRLYVNAETGSWTWVGIPAGSEMGCLIFGGTIPEKRGNAETDHRPAPPEAQF